MKTVYKKKGQAAGAVGSIITLIVGVGVSVMVLIFVGSLGGQTYNLVETDIDAIGNNLIRGESFVALNNTAVPLAHSSLQTATMTVSNGSATGNLVGLGNFTIDTTAGTMLLKSTATYSTYNGSSMFVNYTWGDVTIRNSIRNSVLSGFSALEQTGDYLPVIVLAVVVSLVLFLILGFTSFNNRGSGNVL